MIFSRKSSEISIRHFFGVTVCIACRHKLLLDMRLYTFFFTFLVSTAIERSIENETKPGIKVAIFIYTYFQFCGIFIQMSTVTLSIMSCSDI